MAKRKTTTKKTEDPKEEEEEVIEEEPVEEVAEEALEEKPKEKPKDEKKDTKKKGRKKNEDPVEEEDPVLWECSTQFKRGVPIVTKNGPYYLTPEHHYTAEHIAEHMKCRLQDIRKLLEETAYIKRVDSIPMNKPGEKTRIGGDYSRRKRSQHEDE